MIKGLTEKFGTDHEGKLKISGVLTSKGFNYSLIKDRKFWYFDASFVPDDVNTIVHVPKMYKVEFFNGGVKVEFAYKWVFLFMPPHVDIKALDGSTYGRGIAVAISPAFLGGPGVPLALEGGWMPGHNVPGNMFFIATLLGLGGGASFPKMNFTINPAVKK